MSDIFPIPELSAARREDHRGWLQVLYESETMVLKRSYSRAGVFRGLHVQMEPSPQVKLIRVLSGRILDFILSVRDDDGIIHHREIGPDLGWVRIGSEYAHGFYALEDSLFEYICDGAYDEAAERSFSITRYLEEEMGITNLILSDKDRAAQPIEVRRAVQA